MQPTPPRDFSGATKKLEFTADGDTFYGVPRVATGLMAKIVTNVQKANGLEEQMEAVISFFDVCLTDESAALIRKRFEDKKNPLDLSQAMDIVNYLIEVYADRPTQPSSNSSDGSTTEATGTSSTDGVPLVTSIQVTSPHLVS